MYLNTVFKYNVFKYCPALIILLTLYKLAGPVEISTERGANILFHAIYFFNINVFIELKYWKEYGKNVEIFYTIIQQLKFLMPLMIQFHMM